MEAILKALKKTDYALLINERRLYMNSHIRSYYVPLIKAKLKELNTTKIVVSPTRNIIEFRLNNKYTQFTFSKFIEIYDLNDRKTELAFEIAYLEERINEMATNNYYFEDTFDEYLNKKYSVVVIEGVEFKPSDIFTDHLREDFDRDVHLTKWRLSQRPEDQENIQDDIKRKKNFEKELALLN